MVELREQVVLTRFVNLAASGLSFRAVSRALVVQSILGVPAERLRAVQQEIAAEKEVEGAIFGAEKHLEVDLNA